MKSFSSSFSSTAAFLAPPRTNGCDCDPGGAERKNAVTNLSKDGIEVRGDFEEVPDVYSLDSNIMLDGVYRTEVHTRQCDIALRWRCFGKDSGQIAGGDRVRS